MQLELFYIMQLSIVTASSPPTKGANLVTHSLQSQGAFWRWEIQTLCDFSHSPKDREKEQWALA